jgi:hypothetical protein
MSYVVALCVGAALGAILGSIFYDPTDRKPFFRGRNEHRGAG